MRVVAFGLLALCAPLPLAPAAWAQEANPSAQQIINSLKPTGNVGTTRGIRLAPAPAAPAAPAPAAQPAASAAPAAAAPVATAPAAAPPAAAPRATEAAASPSQAAPSVNLSVEFATDSARLTPAARRTLDALGEALSSSELASYRFRIEGHTDTVGSTAYNLALSQRRADAVAAYIERKFGVSASRLQAVGMGEKDLLVPTPPNTPNAKNRRVEVINLSS